MDEPQIAESQTPETALAPEPAAEMSDATNQPLFSWQASEYLHHDKKSGWYLILAVVTIALVAGAVLTKQWFSIPVFGIMVVAIIVWARKAPRTLTYSLTGGGLMIENKFFAYGQFRSFAVIQDVGWHLIDLEPTQRFMPRLSVMFDDDDFDSIVAILSDRLPREDRQPDFIERLTRLLKF